MIDLKIETSNNFVFSDSSTRLFYRITIQGTPEKTSNSKSFGVGGNWLILIIDQSSSMVGEKLETAKQAAISTIRSLNKGNYVSIYAFSDDVEVLVNHEGLNDIKRIENAINEIYAHGRTALYKTLNTLINQAKDYAEDAGSVSVLLLTDGQPTDVTDIHKYESIAGLAAEYGIKINTIGIGSDYNEEIIKRMSDVTNGEFFHIMDRSEISNIFGNYVEQINKTVATSAILGITLREAKDFKSYDQNFIQQGNQFLLNLGYISDNPIVITGHLIVPPGNMGNVNLLNVNLDYKDEAGSSKYISKDLIINRTNDQQKILSGTNLDVVNAARVKMNIERFEYLASVGDVTGATKAISEARKAAEATKNIKIIESTKKLENLISNSQTGKVDKKQIYSETSKIKKKGD